jgi:hypothetical protein
LVLFFVQKRQEMKFFALSAVVISALSLFGAEAAITR